MQTTAGAAPRAGERAGAQAGPAAGAVAPSGPRLSSLDAARGAMLVVSTVSDSLLAPPAWFEHAAWTGVHPLDLVFPVFVTLSGAGLALAHRRGVRVRRLARRVLVLLAAGLAYDAALDALRTGRVDLHVLRWTGVLPLYALVVLVVALGHLLTRTWRGWAAVCLALAAAHTALLVLWEQRCTGGVLTPACNPSRTLDAAVLPARHLYGAMAVGHDPEGLVGVLGACASAAAGATLAHALLAARSRPRHAGRPASTRPPGTTPTPWAAVPVSLGLALVLAAAALAASALVPAMKRLWTAPFGLGIAAAVVLGVLALHLLLDRAGTGAMLRGVRWPLVALGRNSLLVYFGSHVLMAALVASPRGRAPTDPALALRVAQALSGHAVGVEPQVAFSAVVLAAWLALAAVLHRHRLYVRA